MKINIGGSREQRLADRAVELEQEVERLREALQWVVDSDPTIFRSADFHVNCKCHRCAMDYARAALRKDK